MSKRLEDDVRVALERVTDGSGPLESLLTAVRILVRDLKDEGRPPEKVIITIKRLCGLPLTRFAADTDSSADGSEGKRLSDAVLKTAIDEYYAGSRLVGSSLKGYSLE
ncbi:MAG: hypothetical protein PVSMB1_01930 [Gemmatimonadaceae bacterium]